MFVVGCGLLVVLVLAVSICWRGVAGGCGVFVVAGRDLSFSALSFAVVGLVFGVVLWWFEDVIWGVMAW